MNAVSPIGFSYDPFAREVLENPLPFYRELLENHPGYYVEKYDMFVFTRYDDIVDVLGLVEDNAFVGSESTLPMPAAISHRNDGAPPLPSTNPMGPGIMLPSPEYEEMRLAHLKPLRPKSVAAIQELTRELVLQRLRVLLPQGKFELMGEYCGLVSAAITCQLYGIPTSEAQGVLDAVNALAVYSDEKVGVDTPGMFDQLKAHIVPAIERRRAAGADGEVAIIDGLINHRVYSDGRALTDSEIADQLVCAFVAARDPREYDNPDEFIWNRPIKRLLTFGYGQHHCIGNHLARMQIRCTVGEFLAHVSDFEFAMDEAVHAASYFHWGWIKLPVIINTYSI